MIRLTDIKLPLDHAEGAIEVAIRARLGLDDAGLLGFTVFRRGHDARKRGNIQLIYTLDVDVADEAKLLERFADDRHVQPSPDTSYKFVARAPEHLAQRPIVIGTGPCGLFAGLLLAQMGFRPIILERGKAVRERTVDTFGSVAQEHARTRNRTCSSAKAAPARFPTASSTARFRTRRTTAARC